MAKLPTRLVKARYNVTERTLDRWERDPRLNFPKPEIINRRKYRDDGELDEWDREQSAKGRAASMAAPVVPPLTPEK